MSRERCAFLSSRFVAAQSNLSHPNAIRLAVIDNDSGFIRVLAKRVESAGWQQRHLSSAVPPDELVAMKLGAIVLDPDALGEDGWQYLERIGGMLPELALVVCTGPSSVAQRVRGLRLGADDWISKPCHPEEVIARVEAIVRRRRHRDSEAGPIVVGELEIRPDQFQAFVSGGSLDLTRREFELLSLLAGARGQALEREEIYQRVWGYAMAHGDRSVDVFVRKLRQKLQKRSPDWSYIHTHFGVGYRFEPELAGGAIAEPDTGLAADPGPEALPAERPEGDLGAVPSRS